MTKSALVTGASRGIGRSIALQLAEDGFNVAVNYAGNKEKAEAVVKEIKEKGVESFAIQANVAEGDQVKVSCKSIWLFRCSCKQRRYYKRQFINANERARMG